MTLWLDDGDVQLYHGDCVEVMAAMPEASVDAIVADPPYGIGFMGHEWDQPGVDARANGTPASGAREGARRRRQPSPASGAGHARERALLGGPTGRDNTMHVERGGAMHAGRYDLAPAAMRAFQDWTAEWAAEAFRLLKPGGHLLAFAGPRTYHRMACGVEDAGFEIRDCLAWLFGSGFPKSLDVSKAIDRAAGERTEPIGTARMNDIRNGDYAARSGMGTSEVPVYATDPVTAAAAAAAGWGTALKPAYEPVVLARKPLAGTVAGNFQAHGTGALNIRECRIPHRDDADLRESVAKNQHSGYANPGSNRDSYSGQMPPRTDYDGAAGRWPANVVLDEAAAELLDAQSGIREAGASPAKRSLGSSRVYGGADRAGVSKDRDQLDGGGASRFFYTAKASRSERGDDNTHPTVKPVALMRWLCRLVTPPGGLILDPFCGSGTTPLAARQESFRCVAIDREEEYLEIAARRLGQQSLLSPGRQP